MSKVCHNCGKQVTLAELHKVDSRMEELEEDQMEDLADAFSHCVGPADHFHDSEEGLGIANCCWNCFLEISGYEP